VQLELKDGFLQVRPAKAPHIRKSLTEILTEAKENDMWDGTPAEITEEDMMWLDSPAVGKEN